MNVDAKTAVLISGGLDSAVLLAESLRAHDVVHPLYIRCGLRWETVELDSLRRFLRAVRQPGLRPLQVLDLPVGDVYGDHWSLTGRVVPDAHSPDEAVLLPGRNVLLLAKAMPWCHLRGVPSVALAILQGNPFPDATPVFFDAYAAAVNRALGGAVRIVRPFDGLGKADVLLRGRGLPLELTLSCIRPADGRHCGACNKCAERRRAFTWAGLPDATEYVNDPSGRS